LKSVDPKLALAFLTLLFWAATFANAAEKIPVKVVVVTMFEPGADLGDAPGEYQLWVQREHLDRVIEIPGAYHHARLNEDGVLGIVTGVGAVKASATVMALGLDSRFDLTHAYWVIAGIGGVDPADTSLGSVVWADHVIDGDLAYELDAREIPREWPTGYVPLHKSEPFQQPVSKELDSQIYTLNHSFVHWACNLTRNLSLADNETMRVARARYQGFSKAQNPPFVTEGDVLSASTFWHGALLDRWANDWVTYYTAGSGNYMISAMEDSGTMQALTLLSQARRIDLQRVLVLRSVSNYDRQPEGISAAENLKSMNSGGYSAYLPALEGAERVGDAVVRYLVTHWNDCRDSLPAAAR
jgi:purine nucleoside permease